MYLVPNTLTHERVAAFVDYHNTRHAMRRIGCEIDLVVWSRAGDRQSGPGSKAIRGRRLF